MENEKLTTALKSPDAPVMPAAETAKKETGKATASVPATAKKKAAKKKSAAKPKKKSAKKTVLADADAPQLDAEGYAIAPVSEGGANLEPPVEIENEQYKGIGNANGVIPGESRTRSL